MADIMKSNALIDDEQNKQTQGMNDSFSGTGTSGVVSGSQGNNSLGSGNTQSQPWTNIQAYLGANKDNDSSSKLLTDNVQPGLDKEVDRYGNESKSSLDAGKSQADQATNTYNQFAPNLSASASGSGSQDYSGQARSLMQNAFKSKPFTFNTDNTVKTYGENLKNDDTFYNQQNDFYKKATGGQLSTGQGALQTQLDVNNENLAKTRANILKSYSGFQDGLDSNVKGVNDNLAQYEKSYNDNKNALNTSVRDQNSYLNNESNAHDSKVNDYSANRDRMVDGFSRSGIGVKTADGREFADGAGYYRGYYNNLIDQENQAYAPKGNQWNYIKSILGS